VAPLKLRWVAIVQTELQGRRFFFARRLYEDSCVPRPPCRFPSYNCPPRTGPVLLTIAVPPTFSPPFPVEPVGNQTLVNAFFYKHPS